MKYGHDSKTSKFEWFRNEFFRGVFLSAENIKPFSSRKWKTRNTRHRISVTVMKIKFVAGKNRDISPKYLFYQAQNLMCRRNKYTFLSWRNYLFWKNYAQTETQVLIWYCNSWDLLFNTSASPLHRKQAGQSLFQLLCCSFTSKPCRAPLHEMQWSKLWSPLEMV